MNAESATIERMAKRTHQHEGGERDKDRRTAPTYMVRLPVVFRQQLQKWCDQQEHETRVRPDQVDGVRIALEDFLARAGLWPPQDEE